MKIIAVIPARYASTRFPAKLMQDLGGKTVILRTYEAAVSTNLFDDVFVFFPLADLPNSEGYADPSNLEKFDWKELEDLLPLYVTTATDMTQHFSSFQSTF